MQNTNGKVSKSNLTTMTEEEKEEFYKLFTLKMYYECKHDKEQKCTICGWDQVWRSTMITMEGDENYYTEDEIANVIKFFDKLLEKRKALSK